MQKLVDFLDAGHIALDIEVDDVPSLLKTLAALLVEHDHLSEDTGRRLSEALLGRERLGGTCVGDGVAVPHAYVAEVKHPVLLFARLKHPIRYVEAGRVSRVVPRSDDNPVDLVFLLAGPRSTQRQQVQLLARIVRLRHDRRWLDALRRATSSEEALEAVRQVEQRHV